MNNTAASYTIIGTGAVGGLYGAKLQAAGHTVRFLARSDADWIREHGLAVESVWGDMILPNVDVYTDTADIPESDVILVCLKTTANHKLQELLFPIVRKGTVILLLQNGLGAEEEVAELFPEALVGGCLCFVCSNKTGPGRIHHLDYGRVILAAWTPGIDPDLRSVYSEFNRAGIPAELDESLIHARWRKLVWNIPYNGLSVVLNAETDSIMSIPESRERVRRLMSDVVKGANACGADLDMGIIDKQMIFTDKMKPYSPSMKLDYEAGSEMEIEYIYRRPLAAARSAGMDMPEVEKLTCELEIFESRRFANVLKPEE